MNDCASGSTLTVFLALAAGAGMIVNGAFRTASLVFWRWYNHHSVTKESQTKRGRR